MHWQDSKEYIKTELLAKQDFTIYSYTSWQYWHVSDMLLLKQDPSQCKWHTCCGHTRYTGSCWDWEYCSGLWTQPIAWIFAPLLVLSGIMVWKTLKLIYESYINPCQYLLSSLLKMTTIKYCILLIMFYTRLLSGLISKNIASMLYPTSATN